MYSITNYDELYRPYDKSGGELKKPDFVKLPVKPKGDGLQLLLEQKRGLEVFGVWCLLLEKTTGEKPQNRGKLLNHKEEPATVEEIARGISLRTKIGLVKHALTALTTMGWLTFSGEAEQTSGKVPLNITKDNLTKDKYGEFVSLTKEEHQKLIKKFGEQQTKEKIEDLNLGIGSKGYKYKSHYHTILNWHRRREKEGKAKSGEEKECIRGGCDECGPAIHTDDTGQKYFMCKRHGGK